MAREWVAVKQSMKKSTVTTEVKREQERLRAKKYRTSKKKLAGNSPGGGPPRASDATAQSPGCFLDGVHAGVVAKDVVEWIVRIGCAPSAACARAPLASIVTTVTCKAISRWTVESYRWKIHRFILLKPEELYLDVLREDAVGIVLRYDETPARVYDKENGVISVKAFIRCVDVYGARGKAFELLPRIRRPESGNWSGLLGALDLPSLHLPVLCEMQGCWRYVSVVVDGAAVNRAVCKGLIASCRHFNRLIVVFSLCWSHTLSNAVKWSLGSSFPFGSFLRACHVMQARPLQNVRLLCARAMSSYEHEYAPADRALGQQVWRFFLERFFSVKGPFAEAGSDVAMEEKRAICCRLWPDGLPACGEWGMEAGSATADYVSAVRFLFCRTVPTPILTRWFSVEHVAWYFIGARAFGVFQNVLPAELDEIRYWPGDHPAASFVSGEAYAAQSRDRVARLRVFLASDKFVISIFRAAVSSVPRFDFARSLFPRDGQDAVCRGIAEACASVLNATRAILRGAHKVVEFFISREPLCSSIRLCCSQTLLASLAYLSEKNRPYTGMLWQILRGDRSMSELEAAVSSIGCCCDSGFEGKARDLFMNLRGAARSVALVSLREALMSCGIAYTGKGGCTNLKSESNLSYLRVLALKTPYRPPKLCTGDREVCLRVLRAWHKTWHEDYVREAFGSAREMRSLLNARPPRRNGFTSFCAAMRVFGDTGRRMWENVSEGDRSKWAKIAVEENVRIRKEREAAKARAAAHASVGPLGSTNERLPVCVDEVFSRLNDPEDPLATLWTQESMAEYKRDCERTADSHRLRGKDARAMKRALLPGDLCDACAVKKRLEISASATFFAVISDEFARLPGEDAGLSVGWPADTGVVYFEVVSIVKRPRRLLGFPLIVDHWHAAPVGHGIRVPRIARCAVGAVFDGRSLCALDTIGSAIPTVVCVFEKRDCLVDEQGWAYAYTGKFTLRADLGRRNSARVAAGICVPIPNKRKFRLDAASFDRLFGGCADVLNETADELGCRGDESSLSTSEYTAASSGATSVRTPRAASVVNSDDALVPLHRDPFPADVQVARPPAGPRMSADEREEILLSMTRELDHARYGITVKLRSGNVVVYWNAVEKSRHWERYVRSVGMTKGMHGCTQLTASKSASLSRRSLESCVRRCLQWQAWHAAWIYGAAPAVTLPPRLQLPHGIGSSPSDAICLVDSASDEAAGENIAVAHVSSSDLETSSSEISDTSMGTDQSASP